MTKSFGDLVLFEDLSFSIERGEKVGLIARNGNGRLDLVASHLGLIDVDLDFVLHDPAYVVGVVEAAGLRDVEWYLRGPLSAREETTQRLFVMTFSVRSETFTSSTFM